MGLGHLQARRDVTSGMGDISRMNAFGWLAQTKPETGLANPFDWYLCNIAAVRTR